MQIWVQEEGEKRGPFPTYEIRSRIEAGELDGEVLAWLEGSPDWVPLREMELFRSLFEVAPSGEEMVVPPPLPVRPRPFVRLWARWFDLLLNMVVVFGLLRLLQLDLVAAFRSPLFMLTYLLPWVLLEAIAIHVFGTTPGKWLLGIRVELRDGGRLMLGASVSRSFRVFVLGMGMTLSIFPIICHGLSLWFLMKTGTTFWDRVSGSVVRVGPLHAGRLAVFVTTFMMLVVALQLILLPLSEYMMGDLLKDPEEQAPPPEDSGP